MGGLAIGLVAPTAQAVAAATRHLPSGHAQVLLGRQLGPVVMALGLLAALAGSVRRSAAVVAASTVAVLAGALSVTVPGSMFAAWIGLGAVAAVIAATAGEVLVRARIPDAPEDPLEMERLRLQHGHTHISCFAGERAKSGLRVGEGVIGYQVRWGVAVAVGDPLIPPSLRPTAVDAFLRLCALRRWVPCFYQGDAALRATYRQSGFRLLKFGEEAVVRVADFDLGSSARAAVRHEVARARRAGLEAVMVAGPPGTLWDELQEVSREWLARRGGREMGFSLGRLGELVDTATSFTIARDGDGRVHAFCSWIRMGDDGMAMDLVRRRGDAAPGSVDLCIVTAIERARGAGVARVSLGAVPFRDSLGDAPDGRLARWVRGRLYQRGVRGYRYQGLSHFKGKFATNWESRDVALPRGPSSLLALAALIRLHAGGKPRPSAAPPAPLELGRAGLP